MELKEWILAEHDDLGAHTERTVLRVVPPALQVARVGGAGNSIAWLLWHVARIEDVVINSIVRGRPQVLVADDWPERMGVADARVGTGFEDAEVERFNRAVKVDGLEGYWKAVRTATAGWVKAVSLADLDSVPDVDARLAAIPPIVPDHARFVHDFWRGRSVGFLLRYPATAHGYIHLGEMRAIGGLLGLPGR